jgi:chromate transporter
MSGDIAGRARLDHGAAEVFKVFLRLGCTSFGGAVAHLGCFRAELVEPRLA